MLYAGCSSAWPSHRFQILNSSKFWRYQYFLFSWKIGFVQQAGLHDIKHMHLLHSSSMLLWSSSYPSNSRLQRRSTQSYIRSEHPTCCEGGQHEWSLLFNVFPNTLFWFFSLASDVHFVRWAQRSHFSYEFSYFILHLFEQRLNNCRHNCIYDVFLRHVFNLVPNFTFRQGLLRYFSILYPFAKKQRSYLQNCIIFLSDYNALNRSHKTGLSNSHMSQ